MIIRDSVTIATLQAKLTIAIKALEFYADREHWNISDPNGSAHVINSSDICEYNFGGSIARLSIAKIEGEK